MHLGYRLELALQTRLAQTHELYQLCRVCRKHVSIEDQQPDQRVVALARVVKGICPGCGQSAPARPDRNYRARVRRWLARLRREAAKENRSEWSS